MKNGALVISLDLEMRWGVLESYNNLQSYKNNILGVEKAVEEILNSFHAYDIKATWATVGALLCEDLKEFKEYLPSELPKFNNDKFSSYSYLEQIENEKEQFFNVNIINNILKDKNQEFASHSFSHLFVQEDGITQQDFNNDLISFSKVYKDNESISSFVFPRNQINYLNVLRDNNYKVFRGNKQNWFYYTNSKLARLSRLYNLHFGSNKLGTTNIVYEEGLINIAGTIFLRPFDKTFLTNLRIRRIKKVLKYAKDNNKIVHLWWHPHNFGINLKENINMLNEILDYSKNLGLESFTMKEAGELFEKNSNSHK